MADQNRSAPRSRWPRALQHAAWFVLGANVALHAQELALGAGAMSKANFGESSYSWQIEYRQDFYRNFSASIAMINEGHIPGHHRDGTAWQLWGRLLMFKERMALSVGAGAYYYFDTQPRPGGDTADVHGTTPIFSLAA